MQWIQKCELLILNTQQQTKPFQITSPTWGGAQPNSNNNTRGDSFLIMMLYGSILFTYAVSLTCITTGDTTQLGYRDALNIYFLLVNPLYRFAHNSGLMSSPLRGVTEQAHLAWCAAAGSSLSCEGGWITMQMPHNWAPDGSSIHPSRGQPGSHTFIWALRTRIIYLMCIHAFILYACNCVEEKGMWHNDCAVYLKGIFSLYFAFVCWI